MIAGNWTFDRWVGSASTLHGRPMPVDGRRRISHLVSRGPAVVLGSTSRDVSEALTWGGDPVEVVRRRSGGGLVWLDIDSSTWIDVFVPRDDVLHDPDVGRSFDWLGRALAAAFESLGADARIHEGAYERGPDEGLVCFEGRGRGEVLVGEKKLVGISQRRTRVGSRFQCVWYRTWRVGALRSLLEGGAAERVARAGVGTDEIGLSATGDEVLHTAIAAISEASSRR